MASEGHDGVWRGVEKGEAMNANQKLIEALADIRQRAMDHPAFDKWSFEDRDVRALVKMGGDICDWTTVAILADDALKAVEQKETK